MASYPHHQRVNLGNLFTPQASVSPSGCQPVAIPGKGLCKGKKGQCLREVESWAGKHVRGGHVQVQTHLGGVTLTK
jgi:hypothetical protein